MLDEFETVLEDFLKQLFTESYSNDFSERLKSIFGDFVFSKLSGFIKEVRANP